MRKIHVTNMNEIINKRDKPFSTRILWFDAGPKCQNELNPKDGHSLYY